MASTRIVELFIEDEFDESGIEAISLVSRPAHESPWIAFNSEKPIEEETEVMSQYKIVDEDFCSHNTQLDELGEPYDKLISEGYSIVRIEKITPQMVHKMNQQKFSSPNEPSELDTEDTKTRYKYVGPRDDKNRKFCREMLSKNRVYRIEDIEQLTADQANEEFGYYSIFLWRGSFNCRHQWVRLVYKADTKIRNTASSTKGLEKEEGLGPSLQPDTRPIATVNNVGKPGSKQWKPGTPRQGSSFNSQNDKLIEIPQSKLMFADDEKKILVGAAMVPNRMIHRYDDLGNLYYVFFSKDSIKKMASKFMKQKRTDETSIEHNGIKLGADKVYVTESWISEDPIKDKSHKYGFELPAGTWYVAMKVEDPKIWELVKTKTLTGFSVEGLFAEKSMFSKQTKQINQIKEILKSIKDE